MISEEAIPLILYNNTGGSNMLMNKFLEFKLNENAAKILAKITSPIGVICVTGNYRSGKSYFLNRVILNRYNTSMMQYF